MRSNNKVLVVLIAAALGTAVVGCDRQTPDQSVSRDDRSSMAAAPQPESSPYQAPRRSDQGTSDSTGSTGAMGRGDGPAGSSNSPSDPNSNRSANPSGGSGGSGSGGSGETLGR